LYLPQHFREDRPEVLAGVIRDHPFGVLVSVPQGQLVATHLPFLHHPDRGILQAHMARANAHWRSFEDGPESLVIFQGPHSYVSPSWYEAAEAVPTWNYVTVHAYGRPRVLKDPKEIRSVLEQLIDANEASLPEPWNIDRLSDGYLTGMMKGIVAFEMPITRLEGKFKLSQNRPEADRSGAIEALAGDPIAQLMADAL
jgi:transcriptional regulator